MQRIAGLKLLSMLFPLAFLSEVFKRVGPDFGQGGVVPIGGHKLARGGPKGNAHGKGVDEFAGILPHAFSSEKLATRFLGMDDDMPAFGFHED